MVSDPAVRRPRAQTSARSDRPDSAGRYRAIFDRAGVGISIRDRDGRFVSVNAHVCAMFGYAPDELPGRRYQDVTPAEDIPANDAVNAQLLAGDIDGFTLETRILGRSGNARWVRLTVSLLPSPDPETHLLKKPFASDPLIHAVDDLLAGAASDG